MFEVKVKITGLPEVKNLSKEWKEGVFKGLRKAMLYFERKAKQRFGTAGNINAVTGNYRRNINSSVSEMGNIIVGTLHGNVAYAAVHEYGFKGTVSVPAHNRRTKKSGSVNVRAHTRRVNIPQRPLLTPAISENIKRGSVIIRDAILKETS